MFPARYNASRQPQREFYGVGLSPTRFVLPTRLTEVLQPASPAIAQAAYTPGVPLNAGPSASRAYRYPRKSGDVITSVRTAARHRSRTRARAARGRCAKRHYGTRGREVIAASNPR